MEQRSYICLNCQVPLKLEYAQRRPESADSEKKNERPLVEILTGHSKNLLKLIMDSKFPSEAPVCVVSCFPLLLNSFHISRAARMLSAAKWTQCSRRKKKRSARTRHTWTPWRRTIRRRKFQSWRLGCRTWWTRRNSWKCSWRSCWPRRLYWIRSCRRREELPSNRPSWRASCGDNTETIWGWSF